MKFRNLPAIISLISGLVVCIVTFICGYEVQSTLLILAIAMVLFYLIGLGLRLLLNKAFEEFSAKKEEEEEDPGEAETAENANGDNEEKEQE